MGANKGGNCDSEASKGADDDDEIEPPMCECANEGCADAGTGMPRNDDEGAKAEAPKPCCVGTGKGEKDADENEVAEDAEVAAMRASSAAAASRRCKRAAIGPVLTKPTLPNPALPLC